LAGGLIGLILLLALGALFAVNSKRGAPSEGNPLSISSADADAVGNSGDSEDASYSSMPSEAEPGPPETGEQEGEFQTIFVEGIALEEIGEGPGVTSSIDLPPGVYRFLFQTESSFGTIHPVVEEGTCADFPLFINEPAPFEGSATYRSLGCRVHFEVSDATGDWAITVEAITESELLKVPATFSGDKPTTIGPVDVPQGEYVFAMKTNSPYSMVTPIIVDGLCMERSVFVLAEPGEFETNYYSAGCQIIFQVSNVTENWEFMISSRE
jgi:hypothetical protein